MSYEDGTADEARRSRVIPGCGLRRDRVFRGEPRWDWPTRVDLMAARPLDPARDAQSIESLKASIRGYIRPGYVGGHTSSLVRDVLTVLRDMHEFNVVEEELNAAVRKLVGC